jgi:hypothetical protein
VSASTDITASVEEIKETVRALGHAVRALGEIALLQDTCPLASQIAERGLCDVSDEMLGDPEILAATPLPVDGAQGAECPCGPERCWVDFIRTPRVSVGVPFDLERDALGGGRR